MGKQAVNKNSAPAEGRAVVNKEAEKAAKAEAKAIAKAEKSMGGVVYLMTNKETKEVTRVMPHTFNTGYVLFAKAELAGTDEWMNVAEADMFRFENPNMDGNLTSETYDIEVEPTETKEDDENESDKGEEVAEAVSEDKYKGMKIAGRTIVKSQPKKVENRMLTEITTDTGETMIFSTEELDARLSPEN